MAVSVIDLARRLVPPLDAHLHKGSCGRIAVIGGSAAYSGAPTLAAMAALRCGADLVHVFCPPEAAVPIKAFAPDLVVRPCLTAAGFDEVLGCLPKIHALLVGPGLGQGAVERRIAAAAVHHALRHTAIPVVLDADGLGLLASDPYFLRRCVAAEFEAPADRGGDSGGGCSAAELPALPWGHRVTLTPNRAEFERLLSSLDATREGHSTVAASAVLAASGGDERKALRLAAATGAVVLLKGETDLIATPGSDAGPGSSGRAVAGFAGGGSLRRVSGQGDVFSGLCATFAAWRYMWCDCNSSADEAAAEEAAVAAVFGATAVMRVAQAAAFAEKRRGFVASDVLNHVPGAFAAVMEQESAT